MTSLRAGWSWAICVLCALAVVSAPALAKPYSGAEVFVHDAELYGKYVIRMRAAKGSGIISNFFLWKEGSELPGVFWEEVDVEVFGKDNATSWQSNILTGLDALDSSEEIHYHGSLGDAYHTYTLEWTPDRVSWSLNGEVVRTTEGGQASELTNPAQLRLNFWPPNIPAWVGAWDDSILPVYMYVNWVEYHRWTGSGFELSWRDDFDTLDPGRWGRADWTFAENRADFSPENVVVRDGVLVLAMTHEGQEGYSGTPPADDPDSVSSSSAGSSASSSSVSSSSSVTSSVSSSSSSSSVTSSIASSAASSVASSPSSGGSSRSGSLSWMNLLLLSALLLFSRRVLRR